MMLFEKIFKRGKLGGGNSILREAQFERADQELNILHFNFKDALKFLKQKHKKHFRLPLFMLVGHSSFGKTTLLSNSGLNLSDIYGNSIRAYTSTKYCSWWFSDHAVYLDTAGVYSKTDKEDPHYNLVWMGFLKLLKRYFFSDPISGVIVVIDTPTLLGEQEKLQRVLHDIKERIYEIAKYAKKLPIYVVFTKLDLLAGFNEFFSHLMPKERAESFGFSLPKIAQPSNHNQIFNEKYDILLNSLYSQVTCLLHNNEDNLKRQKIIDFPMQMESFRDRIVEIINIIPNGAHIELSGIYFTSSIQEGNPIDFLESKLLSAYVLQSVPNDTNNFQDYDFAKQHNSYFVTNLFKDIIITERRKSCFTFELSRKKLSYLACSAVLICASFAVWYMGYKNSVKTVDSVSVVLQNFSQSHDLNQLGSFINHLGYVNDSWWASMGFSQTHDLESALKRIYSDAVSPMLVPLLQKTLETVITVNGTSEPEEIYGALKVYQMLGGLQKMDKAFVQNWFARYWDRTVISADERGSLKNQLSVVLTQNIKIDIRQQIIAVAKDSLDSHTMPKEDLIYSTLEQKYKGQDLVLKFPAQEIAISKMYTASNFSKIYNQEIREVVEMVNGQNKDWAPNEKDHQKPINANLDKLVNDVKIMYLRKYANAWSVALNSVKPQEVDNVVGAAHLLTQIANTDIPLLPLLKMAQINTAIDSAPQDFVQYVSQRFVDIDSIDLRLLYANISNTANYLSNIANNTNPNRSAFNAATARFQNNSPQNDALSVLRQLALAQPQPVQNWLEGIVDGSWKALLNSSRNYINSVWVTSVLPQFQKTIANRYPFFKDAKQSVAMDDFIVFLVLTAPLIISLIIILSHSWILLRFIGSGRTWMGSISILSKMRWKDLFAPLLFKKCFFLI